MKHIDDLMKSQQGERNPGQHIGKFLLEHSNSPEYLVSQLSAYLEAAQADLEAERAMFRRLTKRPDPPKPTKFAVVQVKGGASNALGTSGPVQVCQYKQDAQDLAVKIALEGLTEPGDPGEAEVRKEILETGGYIDNSGEWAVCIESIE
jgi:hypothetical protein